jgi:hypothetical protein
MTSAKDVVYDWDSVAEEVASLMISLLQDDRPLLRLAVVAAYIEACGFSERFHDQIRQIRKDFFIELPKSQVLS